jgi:hypothetical protein
VAEQAMTERWAKYKDRPNLRRALLLADERQGSAASPEHLILLGKRLAHQHNSWARSVANALRARGIPFELTWIDRQSPPRWPSGTRILSIRILEGEEARTEQMRRLMRRHEFAAPDERPAIEAQMVALDAEMEGRGGRGLVVRAELDRYVEASRPARSYRSRRRW